MGRVTTREAVLKLGGDAGGGARRSRDTLAAEEPLEIRVAGKQIAVTMRTPGDDFDLVAGYLVGEGVIRDAHQLARMRFCGDSACSGPVGLGGEWSSAERIELGRHETGRIEAAHDTYNIVDVDLAPGTALPLWSLDRNTYTTSACGVCGKSSIEAVRANAHWSVETDPLRITAEVLYSLPKTLRGSQKLFSKTGGLHAAGLFASDGTLLCVREDVGRHNAVDKVIGWAVRDGRLPLRGHLLAVSGRASFELVQKAAAAGIPLLAAVSAPSSLAVELARESGMTLAGFVRGESANVYCGTERIVVHQP
ncbi:MAG TPA: formate dehydrogenase accessory sulfurtransferase FdhD [Actinocrinis sp.]|uniref:formate dehydrogenase accessory sulfurtransferase FdhD n=1 Tax=Actinocrinis sp. TaxID=1920516 RepID=UPI002D36CDD8|nr:formate dehydrogenase accessory sulfurtransferase FdhD [Actinocrinis sp.]HZU56215.1 formate dehydrogenase accessory sulfurtransferase FdhD [Actinocrinis sp.]